MATLSSAEFRNQHRVVNELKDVAAVFARLRQSPTAAGGSREGRVCGCDAVACGGPGVPAPAAAGLDCKTCR